MKVGAGRITRIDFTDDSPVGKATPLSATNGAVAIEVREQPVILLQEPTGAK